MTNVEFINYTASTIMSVLKARPNTLMSWGSRNFKACEFENKPALMFRVSGFIHSGLVYVTYNESSDLYDIYITNMRSRILETFEGAYFDMLTDVIDSLVETKNDKNDEYKKQVDDFLEKTFSE